MNDDSYGPYEFEIGYTPEGVRLTEMRCGEAFDYCDVTGHGVTYCDQPDGHDGPCRNDEREGGTDAAGHDGDDCPHPFGGAL